MTAKQITPEEIWAKKNEFDFEKLLDPYREGGTETTPVRRTMGTIVDWLANKKKYPIEIVGAAILLAFMDLRNGKRFDGDGSYGSKGNDFVQSIRAICDKLARKQLEGDVYKRLAEARVEEIKAFIIAEVEDRTMSRFAKWRKKRKLAKQQKENNVPA